MANKYGLDRNIPSAVKREVRQRCGFGCVVCANPIYDYDHFDPEFKDAQTHDPNGIALLCPTDHTKKKMGLLTEEEYRARIDSPAAFDAGYSFTDWSPASFAPQILLGSFTFTGGTSILEVDGETLLGFRPPEEDGSPPRLLLRVHDRNGVEAFCVEANEIRCPNEAFDVEAIGHTWTVRSALYDIDLVMRFDPPTRITINRLHFRYLRWELIAEIGKLALLFDGGAIPIFTGAGKIKGPVLFSLARDEPKINSSNITFVFGAGPAPIGSVPNDNGFTVNWPVYCPKDANGQYQIVDFVEDRQTLAVYLTQRLANEGAAAGYTVEALQKEELSQLVQQYGHSGLIDSVAFNPGQKEVFTLSDWPDFVSELGY